MIAVIERSLALLSASERATLTMCATFEGDFLADDLVGVGGLNVHVAADHLADQAHAPDPNLLADHRLRQFEFDQRAVDFKNLAHCFPYP